MSGPSIAQDPLAVLAPVHPLVSGAAQFNTAMVTALSEITPVQAISWRRLYPPLIHRRDSYDHASQPTHVPPAEELLDWANPRTWHEALRKVKAVNARGVILPWVHPVMAIPYCYLLRHTPRSARRVVICHNVEPHEPVPMASVLTQTVLRNADMIVIHASQQREELARVGVTDRAIVDAFHPRFVAADLSLPPTAEQVAAERARQGNPAVSLLAFGAIRPYKGIDLALQAIARLPRALHVRLTIAGVCWDGGRELRASIAALGIDDRVELRDGFVSNEAAALLFSTADASLLPYRSASQSGVVQLSFAYGVPVIATSVGGLVEAIADGVDGILCPPGNVEALAGAIRRIPADGRRLAAGVRRGGEQSSFRRYGEVICDALEALPSASTVRARGRRPTRFAAEGGIRIAAPDVPRDAAIPAMRARAGEG
jgi:glycosyltransferase involved in cell wall biosynthesis